MKFNKLSKLAHNKAIADYITGWMETHEDEVLEYSDVFEMLRDDTDSNYDIAGNYLGSEEN